jgi:hypothetical protein
MKRPDPIRERYLNDLHAWLTPDLLYHCFTGENDDEELERIKKLDHVRQVSLLEAAERVWPQRLQQIADSRKAQKQESKEIVEQFVMRFTHD